MPFEDLTGNSGFTSDSDGAQANLDINMSEDSARNLWDVQAAIQQIAADFQTAVRAAADFNSYLISVRETSQTIKMPSMGSMEGGSDGNMSYSGGRVDSGSVPLIQSELGMASRVGEMEENASGAGGGAMAARNTNTRPVDVGQFVNSVTQAAWLTSASGGSHGTPQATSDAYQQAYQFAQGNLRNPQVMRAVHNGQTGTPHAFAASQVVSQGLPAAQQFLRGGGVGGVASILGRFGTFGAIGYAGYQLGDAGLETYAQSRALAISANYSEHGAGWGFGTRLSQAGMAMSPFVSQEEAGQIYSNAIDQGWASRKGDFAQGNFGQAVNFMYGAAKDYNMDPGASAQLLQTNSLGAGQSIQALSQQLLTLKQTLDGTGVSMNTATNTFSSFNSFLIGAGASPGDAASIAGGAIKSFAGNSYLGPNASGAATVLGAMKNPQVQAIVGGLTGNLPGAAFAGSNAKRGAAELEGLVHNLANQWANSGGLSEDNRVAMFQVAYNQLSGDNIEFLKAKELMFEAAADPNFMTRGQKEFDANSRIDYNSGANGKDRNAWDRYTGGVDDATSGNWTNRFNLVNYIEPTSALFKSGGAGFDSPQSFRNYSPKVQNLLANSKDPDQVSVLDDSGKAVATGKKDVSKWFADQSNFDKFSASGSKYTIKDQDNSWNADNIGGAGSAGPTANGATAANTVYITLSDQAKEWFNTNVNKLPMSDGKTHS